MKALRLKTTIAAVIGGLLALGSIPAQASYVLTDNSLQLNFDTVFSGATPTGGTPWLTALFEDTAPNTVTLTITGNLGSQFVSDMYFNIKDPIPLPTVYGNTVNVGNTPLTTLAPVLSNGYKADGDGYYDIRIDWPTTSGPERFDGTNSSTFVFSGVGLDSAMFLDLSASGGNQGVWYGAAHVQGISGGLSAWIAPTDSGPPDIVPVPGAVWLFGSALAGLIAIARRDGKTAA